MEFTSLDFTGLKIPRDYSKEMEVVLWKEQRIDHMLKQ